MIWDKLTEQIEVVGVCPQLESFGNQCAQTDTNKIVVLARYAEVIAYPKPSVFSWAVKTKKLLHYGQEKV